MKLVLICLFILIATEAYLAPFTKVEESFNLQAIHDIVHQVDHYDHLDFPGVVPRTFLGATLISVLAWPFVQFLLPEGLDQQVLVRIILAAINVFALGQFASRGVVPLFGSKTGTLTVVLFICQFHLVFWSSRTLPNMFAFSWIVLGLSHWLSSLSQTSRRASHLEAMIRYLTFAGVIFRFEAGIMLVILLVTEYSYGGITLKNSIKQTAVTALISLLISVLLDSYFWQQWIWPEGMVFYFNAILNKSSEWGTLPLYAYFINFLPRLLLISYPLAIIGYVKDTRVRRMLTPMIIYIGLFSLLPHKEWRFIIYTIPVFTAAAASSVSSAMIAAKRSVISRVALLITILGMLGSLAIAFMMFQVSRLNYPGGEALYALHNIEKNAPYAYVHMDADTAMTGASLFGQQNANWLYSKNESHITQQHFIEAQYTHIITATPPEKFEKTVFEVIDETFGLDEVALKPLGEIKQSVLNFKSFQDLSPIQFKMVPKLYTLKLIQPQKKWAQATLRKYPLVLYSKTYCPYCRAAKQLLAKYCKEEQIKVIEVDLQRDAREIQQALYELTGQYTFPNFFKGGQSLGGFDRLSELDRQGHLVSVCK